jgi:hypothetical protein
MDTYDDFLMFEPTSEELLKNVCYAIVDHNFDANRDESINLFLPFFDCILIKICCATRIQ